MFLDSCFHDLEDPEAELESGGEDVCEEAARGDDPAPVALGVVVLPERRGLAVASQRWKGIEDKSDVACIPINNG